MSAAYPVDASREGRRVNRRACSLVGAAVLAIVLSGAGAPVGAQDRGASLTIVEPGQLSSAPLFAAAYVDLENRAARLARQAGRPMIVNFWARWCGPCKAEIPELIALRAREPGVDIVGINIENDPAPVRDFARAYEIDYPVLLARDAGLDLMRGLGNDKAGLPFTVVLDAHGVVVGRRVGLLTRATIDAAVERVRR